MADRGRKPLTDEELEAEGATELPDREELSIVGGILLAGGIPAGVQAAGVPAAPAATPTGDGALAGQTPENPPLPQ